MTPMQAYVPAWRNRQSDPTPGFHFLKSSVEMGPLKKAMPSQLSPGLTLTNLLQLPTMHVWMGEGVVMPLPGLVGVLMHASRGANRVCVTRPKTAGHSVLARPACWGPKIESSRPLKTQAASQRGLLVASSASLLQLGLNPPRRIGRNPHSQFQSQSRS